MPFECVMVEMQPFQLLPLAVYFMVGIIYVKAFSFYVRSN